MTKQETFPFAARADESQKNAIVTEKKDKFDVSFLSLAWVLRARSNDDTKMNLCGLYSDGQGQFVSSDGHRLHLAEIPSLTERIPAGIWLHVHSDKNAISLKEAPDTVSPYPNVTKLLDMTEDHTKRGVLSDFDDDSMAVWGFWDLVGVKCNIHYLLDILKGESFDVYANEKKGSAIFFCSEGTDGMTKKAVLMPFKE